MAVSFNGVDDSYSLAGETTLRYEYTQAFSGHAWIKKDAVTGNCIMGKAQNAPPGADQRGWAFNTENISGNIGISFHLVNDNSPSQHAFLQGLITVTGVSVGLVPTLWVPVGFTYNGNGLISGMTLYAGGVPLTDIAGDDTLGGNTIRVDGVPMRIGGFDTEFWAGTLAGIVLVPAELSAADMLELGNISNMYVDPDTFLPTPADVWLPLRDDGGSVDLTDYSGNGHNASIGSGAPAVADDPTLVFDTMETTNFTSSTSWTNTPIGPVSAVAVMIGQNVTSSDLITSVTYGGIEMTRVLATADPAGEPGAAYFYILTENIPQGAQTVAPTVSSGTDDKTAWVVTLNSDGSVTVTDSELLAGDTANPSVTLGTTADWVGMAINICFSGLGTTGSLTAGTGYTKLGGGRDFGNQVVVAEIGNFVGANIASGWTAAVDDVAMVAVALEAPLPEDETPQAIVPHLSITTVA